MKTSNLLQELYEDSDDDTKLAFYRWVIERPPENATFVDTATSALRALKADELAEVIAEVLE